MQLRSVATHPFGILSGYVPLGGGETAVYRAVREAVPVIDAAVVKLIRLTGGFSVECPDKLAEAELREFLRTVPVGRGQQGLESFLDSYLDSMLTCGRAVGEIVTRGDRDIAAVLCGKILPMLAAGQLRRVLFLATGALMSQTTFLQGESIPGIAHCVELGGAV